MAIKLIYYVHATTTDNEMGIATGWAPGQLSDLGLRRAKNNAKGVANLHFDLIFSSDLKRAVDTAHISFANFEVLQDQRLREIHYGDFTQKVKNFSLLDFVAEPFPNGESCKDVEYRVRSFLEMLLRDYQGKTIAVISHHVPQLALEVLVNGKCWIDAISTDWRKTDNWQLGWEYIIEFG